MRPILFADDLTMEDPAVHAPLSHILPTRCPLCRTEVSHLSCTDWAHPDGGWLYPPAPAGWADYPEGLEEWHATCELLWALMRIIE